MYGSSILLFALVIFLFWEYRQLHWHINKMQSLQVQYSGYIDAVRRILQKHNVAIDGALPFDSFTVVNRSPVYLQHASDSYIKQQHVDSPMPEEISNPDNAAQESFHSRKSAHRAAPKIKTKKTKRAPITDISFALPLEREQFWLSSYFGPRKKPNGQWGFHHGLDMAAYRGTLVKAVASGVVQQAEFVSGYGNTILIDHDEVYKTRYAHLDSIGVSVGEAVAQGQQIGKVGDTGFTRKMGKDASHLHLEVYENGKKVNPMHLIDI